MAKFPQTILALALIPALNACVAPSNPPPGTASRAPQQRPQSPSPIIAPTDPAPPSAGFIPPQVMRLPGLENIIGKRASELQRRLGEPRLNVVEGDARKLQFTGEACVLDIYLYPMQPRSEPIATHVEARRASDGRPVDRAACVRALGGN